MPPGRVLLEQAQLVAKGRPEVLNAIGLVLLQAGQYDDALGRFTEALAGGVPEARLNAARARIALGQTERARLLLKEGVRADPSWAPGAALLSELEARNGDIKGALAVVAAYRAAGGAPGVADELQGDALAAAGRYPGAIDSYTSAATRVPSARLALKIHSVYRAGHLASPERPLLEWLRTAPGDLPVRRALAGFYQSQGDRPRAIAEYERVTTAGPRSDAVALNNLAWLYMEVRDPRALETARRAYEAWPDMPEIADTYGWILVRNDRAQLAIPILERGAQALTDKQAAQYHLGVAYARSGDTTKAAARLHAALQAPGDFDGRADAEQLLKTLHD
jgi:cellulose synthase operon protein C